MITVLLLVALIVVVALCFWVFVLSDKNKNLKNEYDKKVKELTGWVELKDSQLEELSKAVDLLKFQSDNYENNMYEIKKELLCKETSYSELKDKYDKLLNQKKSSEVKLGKTAENHAPFFTEWPYDARKFRFMGDPVDGVQFNEDSIIFVEIKTGKSRLSPSQRNIRDLVKAGAVKFGEFRISDSECTFKLDE